MKPITTNTTHPKIDDTPKKLTTLSTNGLELVTFKYRKPEAREYPGLDIRETRKVDGPVTDGNMEKRIEEDRLNRILAKVTAAVTPEVAPETEPEAPKRTIKRKARAKVKKA